MYVCVYVIFVNVSMYACMCVYYVYVYVCVHVHMHACVCMCVSMYVCMCVPRCMVAFIEGFQVPLYVLYAGMLRASCKQIPGQNWTKKVCLVGNCKCEGSDLIPRGGGEKKFRKEGGGLFLDYYSN